MKLSEKYLEKLKKSCINNPILFTEFELKLYSEIISFESQQTLLVSSQSYFSQDKYIDKLSEIMNGLQEISMREQL